MNEKVVGLIIILALVAAGTASAQGTCNPQAGTDFCVENVDLPEDGIETGSEYVIEVTVRNTGQEPGDVRVLYGAKLPERQVYGIIGEAESVEPGEEVVLRAQAEVVSSGYRSLNVMAMNSRETHLFDSTGYEYSVTASEDNIEIFNILSNVKVLISIIVGLLTIIGYMSRN